MINYTDILREHNLKVTPQRLAISDALYTKGHIGIEPLYAHMLKKFNSISLATIYKNIHIMVENSFIQEVKIPNAKSVYELKKATHSHLVCKSCGCVDDITIDLKDIIDETSRVSSFNVSSTDIVFSGFCSKCQ